MQRFFDIIFSAIALLILLPLLIPIGLLLWLTGEHEIFYVQERIGLGEQPFGLYKFATMLKSSPNIGAGSLTVRNDPRVLPIGRFLRKSKINELPQLLNILKGDMSIIGPRPLTPDRFAFYTPSSKRTIGKVRPGLSGVGSIVFHDEEALLSGSKDVDHVYATVIIPYKAALEEWYVEHQGLGTYMLCITLTAWVILFPSSRAVWRVFSDLPPPPKSVEHP